MVAELVPDLRDLLREGICIPAHPLALDANRQFDERRQRALTRYYLAAGVGGLAVGVHTTQFAIRDPAVNLYRRVLQVAAQTVERDAAGRPVVLIAGICGTTSAALEEARLARDLGYHLGLVNLGGLGSWSDDELIAHVERIGQVLPVMGFYLQPAVGGRLLGFEFWRRLADLPSVAAIKMAPFNRYQTLDVVRAVASSTRHAEIALYTGNDDHIVLDLTTPFFVEAAGQLREMHIVGGLLGQWAVWTKRAVAMLEEIKRHRAMEMPSPLEVLAQSWPLTDANAALFDPNHGFKGTIAGIHEVLRRQGLLAGRWCLDSQEDLSPGQMQEIDRVTAAYPELQDNEFVRAHLEQWMS